MLKIYYFQFFIKMKYVKTSIFPILILIFSIFLLNSNIEENLFVYAQTKNYCQR